MLYARQPRVQAIVRSRPKPVASETLAVLHRAIISEPAAAPSIIPTATTSTYSIMGDSHPGWFQIFSEPSAFIAHIRAASTPLHRGNMIAANPAISGT